MCLFARSIEGKLYHSHEFMVVCNISFLSSVIILCCLEPTNYCDEWHVFICREDVDKDNVDLRRSVTAAALGTVMGKLFGLRSPHSSALLDRFATFVSKDKSLKAKLMGKTRKVHKNVIL